MCNHPKCLNFLAGKTGTIVTPAKDASEQSALVCFELGLTIFQNGLRNFVDLLTIESI